MNGRNVSQRCVVTALLMLGSGLGRDAAMAANEAFADNVTFDPEPGLNVEGATGSLLPAFHVRSEKGET